MRKIKARNHIPEVRAIYDKKGKTIISKNGVKIKRDNSKTASVQIEVYFDRQRLYASTGVKIHPDQWNTANESVIRHNNSYTYNKEIQAVKDKVFDYLEDCRKRKVEFTLQGLRNFLDQKEEYSSDSFLAFFYERIFDKPISQGTKKAYLSIYNRLESWGKIKTFSDINTPNILEWHELAISESSSYNYNRDKVMKVIINDAILKGHLFKNPYDQIKLKRDNTIKHEYLSESELQKFLSIDLDTPSLNKSRDLFQFMAYTGLAYVDAMAFDFAKCICENGCYKFTAKRQKTNEEFHLLLLKPALEILEKYGNQVPKVDMHVHNRNLKTIASLCKINKTLSSHCARVTWASTIAQKYNIPLGLLALTMGHTNIRQTAKYAKQQQYYIDKTFTAINEQL